jgi:hypothetical protein
MLRTRGAAALPHPGRVAAHHTAWRAVLLNLSGATKHPAALRPSGGQSCMLLVLVLGDSRGTACRPARTGQQHMQAVQSGRVPHQYTCVPCIVAAHVPALPVAVHEYTCLPSMDAAQIPSVDRGPRVTPQGAACLAMQAPRNWMPRVAAVQAVAAKASLSSQRSTGGPASPDRG